MTPALMPGGFAPRYGAFVLGAVLFLTSNVVSESVAPGYLKGKARLWASDPVCRASFLSVYPMTAQFAKRFHRDDATGCFGTEIAKTQDESPFWFLVPEIARTMGQPFKLQDVYVNGSFASNLKTPDKHHIPDKYRTSKKAENQYKDAYCYYQCITWKEIAFSDLVGQLGMIFAGAAVVVKITDSVSGFLGWHLVDEDTDIKTLVHIRQISVNVAWASSQYGSLAVWVFRVCHKSRLFCAIQLILMDEAAFHLAQLIDVDGFFTVDFYVTWVLILCVFDSIMLRFWNPYSMTSIVYTKKLWKEGVDRFMDLSVDPPRLAKCDLFEWFHLSAAEQMYHLTMYARRVGLDSVQDKSDDVSVICLKTHDADAEVYEKTDTSGCTRVVARRFNIPRYTLGTITGKNAEGKLIVDWDLKGKDGVQTLTVDECYVSQWNSEWEQFMRDSGFKMPSNSNTNA